MVVDLYSLRDDPSGLEKLVLFDTSGLKSVIAGLLEEIEEQQKARRFAEEKMAVHDRLLRDLEERQSKDDAVRDTLVSDVKELHEKCATLKKNVEDAQKEARKLAQKQQKALEELQKDTEKRFTKTDTRLEELEQNLRLIAKLEKEMKEMAEESKRREAAMRLDLKAAKDELKEMAQTVTTTREDVDGIMKDMKEEVKPSLAKFEESIEALELRTEEFHKNIREMKDTLTEQMALAEERHREIGAELLNKAEKSVVERLDGEDKKIWAVVNAIPRVDLAPVNAECGRLDQFIHHVDDKIPPLEALLAELRAMLEELQKRQPVGGGAEAIAAGRVHCISCYGERSASPPRDILGSDNKVYRGESEVAAMVPKASYPSMPSTHRDSAVTGVGPYRRRMTELEREMDEEKQRGRTGPVQGGLPSLGHQPSSHQQSPQNFGKTRSSLFQGTLIQPGDARGGGFSGFEQRPSTAPGSGITRPRTPSKVGGGAQAPLGEMISLDSSDGGAGGLRGRPSSRGSPLTPGGDPATPLQQSWGENDELLEGSPPAGGSRRIIPQPKAGTLGGGGASTRNSLSKMIATGSSPGGAGAAAMSARSSVSSARGGEATKMAHPLGFTQEGGMVYASSPGGGASQPHVIPGLEIDGGPVPAATPPMAKSQSETSLARRASGTGGTRRPSEVVVPF